jgi:hypothetical protein
VSALPVDIFKRMLPAAWSTMSFFRQASEGGRPLPQGCLGPRIDTNARNRPWVARMPPHAHRTRSPCQAGAFWPAGYEMWAFPLLRVAQPLPMRPRAGLIAWPISRAFPSSHRSHLRLQQQGGRLCPLLPMWQGGRHP